MSEANRANHFPSEASRMLEAALEQMDGIIQGAKYELPQYFDSFSIQVLILQISLCSFRFIKESQNTLRKYRTFHYRGNYV